MIKKYAAAILLLVTLSSVNLVVGLRGIVDYFNHAPGTGLATLIAHTFALATIYPLVHWLITLRKLDVWEKDRLALEDKFSKLKQAKPTRKVADEMEALNIAFDELLARRPVFLFSS